MRRLFTLLVIILAILVAFAACDLLPPGWGDPGDDPGDDLGDDLGDDPLDDPGDDPPLYPVGPYGTDVGDIVVNVVRPDSGGTETSFGDLHTAATSTGFPKVIVADFSAPWCAPCQQAAMELQTMYDAHEDGGNHDVAVMTILLDGWTEDSVATVEVAQAWQATYTLTTITTADIDDTLTGEFAIGAYPTLLVIDPVTMEIESRIVGWPGTPALEDAMAPVIARNTP